MAAPNAIFKQSAIAAAQQQLADFAQANVGVKLAVLTSGDGFELAASPAGAPSTARIAAMTSSIQALSQALAAEAGLNGNRSLIIETDSGTLLLLALEQNLPRVSLAVIASGKELLGKLLWTSRNLCKALEKALNQ